MGRENLICLGIESTAHTFGIGIIDETGKVLANRKSTYRPKEGYGIIPKEAGEYLEETGEKVLAEALRESGLEIGDVDIIAFSQGPGLPLSLKTGLEMGRKLAKEHGKPLFGANHCIGHIEIGALKTGAKDPITVYASGGNTQIIGFAEGRYRVFGETEDVAIGNALDMFARGAGLAHPGGPKIEALATKGKYVELPYVVKGMDLSYTGIVSQALRLLKQGKKLEDLCFSIQETCFAMLTEVAERALAHTGKAELLLTGGVAANRRLQEMMKIMCEERDARFFSVPLEYAGDNGLMIAWAGLLMQKSGQKPITISNADIKPRWRTDEVDVSWR